MIAKMKKLLGALTLITLLQSSPIIAQEQSLDPIPVTSSEYIQKVVDSKLMDNFPDGKFYQDKLISRAELASILVKAFYLDKRAIIPEKKSLFITVKDRIMGRSSASISPTTDGSDSEDNDLNQSSSPKLKNKPSGH